MAIPKELPKDPHAVIHPDHRWYPGDEQLGDVALDPHIPPLVDKIRREVKKWRENNYQGASATTRALLQWWFNTPRPANENGAAFRYYFAQREAVESVIWLYEAQKVRDKHDLSRFDSSGTFIPADTNYLPEEWRRFVVKMATGSGKTKVMSLVVAWSYFHKLYEENSDLSRNILLVAPNIIVLDRLARDFDGLKIFHADPVLPPNGYEGKDWQNDFQMKVHLQDEVSAAAASSTGNIFLTNIHRVYEGGEAAYSADDDDSANYFLGAPAAASTTASQVDLGRIVREVDELLVINDEAHHIHDPKMAWFKSIQDVHHRLVQKGKFLSLQADFTATPRHNKGAIFPQTISDYPLVEAIYQNVVKQPVTPDDESEAKLREKNTIKYAQRYSDYLDLGVQEWRKAHEELKKAGEKAILFVMTDNTKNCDEVKKHLEQTYEDLAGKILVIHTKENGEFKETAGGKDKAKLEELRALANSIDDFDNKYLAVISVLMLREGWDVRNVTTIVGLRAYTSKAKILPEQTLGRGLRRVFVGQEAAEEKVSVIGTAAFMEFVKEIEKEGVILQKVRMGKGVKGAQTPAVIYIDHDKDIAKLDIAVPRLTPRYVRDYARLKELDAMKFENFETLELRDLQEEGLREITFEHIVGGEKSHTTILRKADAGDYSQVVGFYANVVMREMKLFSGYDFIYAQVLLFVRERLFGKKVELMDPRTLRNLGESAVGQIVAETFRREINALLLSQNPAPQLRDPLMVSAMKSFVVPPQEGVKPKKSAQNLIIGQPPGNKLELNFAKFLDTRPDVEAFAKNYMAVNFRLDYADARGEVHDYLPDFIIKDAAGKIFIVETKGRVDINDPRKFRRLQQWRDDVNAAKGEEAVACLFIEQSAFESRRYNTFAELAAAFKNAAPDPATPPRGDGEKKS